MGMNYISIMIKRISMLLGMFFVTASASADTAVIPNTFMAGQAAVAQDVNDNFTALKSAIDGNVSRIPVLRDGDGIDRGTIISMEYSYIVLMSNNAYMYTVLSNTGEMPAFQLLYELEGCVGPAYTRRIQNVLFDGTGYLYVPKGTAVETITTGSATLEGSGACDTPRVQTVDAYPTSANDPAITGVENAPLALPLTIETL